MTGRKRWALLAGVLVLAGAALAEQRYSVPRMPPDYQQPDTEHAEPRTSTMEIVDTIVLVAFLGAASFLALRLRSRWGLLVLTLLALGYFGFYRKGCVCPIGAIQHVSPVFDVRAEVRPDTAAAEAKGVPVEGIARALRDRVGEFTAAEPGGEGPAAALSFWVGPESKQTFARVGMARVPATEPDQPPVPLGELVTVEMRPVLRFAHGVPWVVVAFFLLPLVATLLFGRAFCAAVCPLGAIQEAVAVRPVQIPEWLGHGLGMLPWAYIATAVLLASTGSAYIICRYDPFVGMFRLSGATILLLVGAAFLVAGIFLARPYCRFVCPYGAILRPLSRLSWRKTTITPDKCIHCRLCEDSCPYGAIRKPNTGGPPRPRSRGKATLAAMLLLVPLVTAGGAGLGWLASEPLSRMHPIITQAEAVRAEMTRHGGKVKGDSEPTEAFNKLDIPADMLFAHARAIRTSFDWAAPVAGGALGLIVGLKLVSLSVRRRQEDYEPDRAICLSCGRCYASCPVDHVRRQERKQRRQTRKLEAK